MALQQLRDGSTLIKGVLQQQPTARVQMLPRMLCNMANGVQTIAAGDERALGLEAHIAHLEVHVVMPDVGRIAYDEVRACADQGREPCTRSPSPEGTPAAA